MIQVRDVEFSYGKQEVLKGISFCMEKGEFVCVLGANGCGKTTLLKSILAFLTPQHGQVLLYGKDIHQMDERERARKIAYIPQYHTPPFPFTVRDVVLMGRTPHLSRICRPTEKDCRIADESMERLGIAHYANKSYTALSGGQRQMVVIARALAQQPDLLIMDEPTASLDFGNQYLVLAQVKKLAREGMGVLMVTHNPDHAFYCADRIIAMEDGKILSMGDAGKVINEAVMKAVYHMPVKVRSVSLGEGLDATICIPVPDLSPGRPAGFYGASGLRCEPSAN
ncbi:ABC transporter ATP-binding protein [Anaerotruncus colihominis]|uniref:ABC transporter, ATP-binding protein n=2 Tax=Anaerotruncus colihominis TaxID=169435 RepID=B0PDC7_9FIRM|nr:ABC transporter ATP-binding protein [Anaerotruncus colihominis]EDS10479.1 ABC transporter, ATP-binding protein [Anaerotruncus colihominis DSM 17241]MBS4989164.1 ABC transporter ATP-binding protein [Anaerotruncus colihominis]MCQ4735001.1 ABC transporter ATP-binding protein [Anaerotruncus colihominis]OUO66924.1 iron ABC transporter ATP-binding protein [Anaerotruncus colihominis]OUP70052.1 iron ABC transporter ATP-binding protein [Anaerotruncus colihominis]